VRTEAINARLVGS